MDNTPDPFAFARQGDDAENDKSLATPEQWAHTEFEPWDTETVHDMMRKFSDGWLLTVDSDVAVGLRLAAVIMGKSKGELVKVAEELSEEAFGEMLDMLQDSRATLAALADLLDSAHTRRLVGAAALAFGGEA